MTITGNQLSQTLGSTTTNYGYGSGSDQLATISVGGVATQAIGYSADGRIASLNPGIQAPGGQSITSLSYNQDAELSAVNAGSGALASYTYDGFGKRLIKTVSGSYGEIYQYGQDGALLEETDASGVAQADYIYLNGRPVAVLNGSTLYFLHDDRLGTPQLATDNEQNTQWQTSYEPFGQTTSVSGTITQNLRLPGQYFDVESGFNHSNAYDEDGNWSSQMIGSTFRAQHSSLFRCVHDFLFLPRRELSNPLPLDASVGIEKQHGRCPQDLESIKFLTEDPLNLHIILSQESAAGGYVIRHDDENMGTEHVASFLLAELPVKRQACIAEGTPSADGDHERLWITTPPVSGKRRNSLARGAHLIAPVRLPL